MTDTTNEDLIWLLQCSSIEHNLPLFKESLGDDYDSEMFRVYGTLWDNYKKEIEAAA
jgi:hypothetical protein